MMKNKGFYQKMNVIDETDRQLKLSTATQNHFLFHRVAYSLDNDSNLDYKVKTFYAIDQYSKIKSTF